MAITGAKINIAEYIQVCPSLLSDEILIFLIIISILMEIREILIGLAQI